MSDNFKTIQDDFVNLVNGDRLFHAYLFFGEQTAEIFEFSEKLASFLETNEFKKSVNFLNDLIVINKNENGNIVIDEVRNMQKFLYQSPNVSKKRTAIINNADGLTDEAQSGILKIIEEPPKDSLIILVINRENLLLETLRSRMGKIYFHKTQKDTEPSTGRARKNAEKENVRNLDNLKTSAEDNDIFFKKTIIDLSKNLSQNSVILKEVLKRLSLMKQFNLNNKLQLKLLNFYLKDKSKK